MTEDEEHFDCSVSFGQNTYVVTLPRISSGEATVSFGELTLDLTQCGEIADGCELDLGCSFGQLTLLVPKSCQVISDSGTAFGCVEFCGEPDRNASTTIELDAGVSFGEIEIRYI